VEVIYWVLALSLHNIHVIHGVGYTTWITEHQIGEDDGEENYGKYLSGVNHHVHT
jgi:hypothetical protein